MLKQSFIRSNYPIKSLLKVYNHSTSKKWDYDIVINGGSIVGAALACSLLHLTNGGLKICIVDTKSPPVLSDCLNRPILDIRTYALSPASIQFLETIKAWDFMKSRVQPYKSMQIWESYGPGLVRFHANEINMKQLGCIAENSTILASIYEAMKIHPHHSSSIDYKFGSGVKSFSVCKSSQHSYGEVNISLFGSSSEQISSRLLVGADGADSVVRKLSNLSTYGWSYGQGLIGTVKVDNNPEADYDGMTSYQRYLPSGPIALLPLWNDYCSVVWSLPMSELTRIQLLSNEELIKTLNNVLQSNSPNIHHYPFDKVFPSSSSSSSSSSSTLLEPWKQLSRRIKSVVDTIVSTGLIIDPKRTPPIITELSSPSLLSFSLQFQQASKYYAPRVALVGDAAHSIHPQAGQGLNLGIADSRILSNLIYEEGVSVGQDIGDESILKSYHNKRYLANLSMMGSVDIINSIFSEPIPSITPDLNEDMKFIDASRRSIRSIGMIGVHSLPQVKAKIAKFATGLDM